MFTVYEFPEVQFLLELSASIISFLGLAHILLKTFAFIKITFNWSKREIFHSWLMQIKSLIINNSVDFASRYLFMLKEIFLILHNFD